MADPFAPALRVRAPMRRVRRHRLRYDRIFIVGLFATLWMFTAGCVIGAYHHLRRGSGRGIDGGAVHAQTTYRVAHDIAERIAWSLRGSHCPTPEDIGHPIDPWGHGYVVACADTIVVMSAGEDGRFGTDDDVVSR